MQVQADAVFYLCRNLRNVDVFYHPPAMNTVLPSSASDTESETFSDLEQKTDSDMGSTLIMTVKEFYVVAIHLQEGKTAVKHYVGQLVKADIKKQLYYFNFLWHRGHRTFCFLEKGDHNWAHIKPTTHE